jgi:hypothetical protein
VSNRSVLSPAAGIVLASAVSVFVTAYAANPPHPQKSAPANFTVSDVVQHPISKGESRALYDRFKKLAGVWEGNSTKGWTERETVKVIAGESAVLFESFDAHPGETMLTLVHMDGDRLMITHYCVAKNQPRLVATSISDDGKTVIFTFLDATNLASRDVGHMDKVKFEFADESHYTSQWTWYQNGHEDWMEKIVSRRLPGDADRTH